MDTWPFHPPQPHLRLATAEPPAGMEAEALADPFITVGERGGYSRVLIGEVTGAGDAPLLRVALKLQSDEYPVRRDGAAGGLTAEDVEAAWRRELAVLASCGRSGTGVPAPVEVLDRAPDAPATLAPTIYCKRRRAYFAAPCPHCGGPLADLRDDPLLESLGLPRRDRSLARFLACPRCFEQGVRQLWTLIKEGGSGGASVQIGDAGDLFRAYEALSQRPGAVLPCQGCEHRPTCHDGSGGGDAGRLLTPVTFYESYAVALPLAPLRWHEAMRLAGGGSLAAIAQEAATERGRAREIERLGAQFASQPAHLFAHDAGGKLGLEVLRLKLGLFAQLCRAVAALHRHAGTPHLGLSPGRILATLPPDVSGLPWLWRLGVSIAGLGNARARAASGEDAAAVPVTSYERPRVSEPVFASPLLRQAPLEDLPGVVTVTGLTPVGNASVEVELVLEAETVDLGDLTTKDLIDLSIAQARPPLVLELTAVLAGRAEGGVRMRSLPIHADDALRRTLGQLVGTPLPRARFAVHPCLHAPIDVYALGMLLLTGLLSHPGRSPAAVAVAVDEVRRRLLEAVPHSAGDTGDALAARAVAELGGEPFAKGHLFADPEAHPGAAEAVPDALWLEALLVGLRAVTWLRGFGICRDAADFDPQHPEVKTEYLLELVESLIRRVDAALFGLPGRDAEIRAALVRIAREMKVE